MENIKELKTFLRDTFPDTKIFLFGSRARGDASSHSDIDIAIKAEVSIGEKLAEVRFAIEESQIPWKVDIIDLSQAAYLQEVIEREGIRWH